MPEQEKTPQSNGAASKKSNKKTVLVIVIAMLVMAGVALYVGRSWFIGAGGSTVNVSVPLIVTPLVQPSTGQVYNVQTLFSVQMDTNARLTVSDKELEAALASIMTQMDIDKILSKGRVEYINDRATELLTAYLIDEGADPRVLLVDLATDDRVTLTSPEGRSNRILEGIKGLD